MERKHKQHQALNIYTLAYLEYVPKRNKCRQFANTRYSLSEEKGLCHQLQVISRDVYETDILDVYLVLLHIHNITLLLDVAVKSMLKYEKLQNPMLALLCSIGGPAFCPILKRQYRYSSLSTVNGVIKQFPSQPTITHGRLGPRIQDPPLFIESYLYVFRDIIPLYIFLPGIYNAHPLGGLSFFLEILGYKEMKVCKCLNSQCFLNSM